MLTQDNSNDHLENQENVVPSDAETSDSDSDNNTQCITKFYIVELGATRYEVLRRYTDLQRLTRYSCLARDIIEDVQVIIKKISKPFLDIDHAKRTFEATKFFRLVDHLFIARLIDAFTAPQGSPRETRDVYLVMELTNTIPLYRLRGYITSHAQLSVHVLRILNAVKHLHSAGIIHQSLSPWTIGRNQRTLKILDCGEDLSRRSGPRPQTFYCSPECFLDTPSYSNGPKTDIWSLGCIMAEMVSGRQLFSGATVRDQWSKITELLGTPSGEFIDRLPEAIRNSVVSWPRHEGIPFDQFFSDDFFSELQPDDFYLCLNSGNARDLLSRIMVIDPRQRISVDEAIEHPYLKCWYTGRDPEKPPAIYDNLDEPEKLTIKQFERLIYNEIRLYDDERVLKAVPVFWY